MSNVCPHCLKSVIGLTEFGPDFDKDWTDSVHDLLLDRDWTESGQNLYKDWILRPTSVQPHFSNKHPNISVFAIPGVRQDRAAGGHPDPPQQQLPDLLRGDPRPLPLGDGRGLAGNHALLSKGIQP